MNLLGVQNKLCRTSIALAYLYEVMMNFKIFGVPYTLHI